MKRDQAGIQELQQADFTRLGQKWGAIIGCPDLSPGTVALCLIALKLSRESHPRKTT